MQYWDLNQAQAAQLASKDLVALLPIGAVEVHGDHLPLGTDCFLAQGVANKVELALTSERCVVLPCLPYGQIWSLRDVPGCINVPDAVLSATLVEIAKSIYAAGITRIAFINGHVGNVNAIKDAMRILYDQCPIKAYSFTYPDAEGAIAHVCTSKRPHKAYFHACEIETSYMLYLCPEKVDMSKAICQYPTFPEDFDVTPSPWNSVMHSAVMGDATVATAEKGQVIIDTVVAKIVHLLR